MAATSAWQQHSLHAGECCCCAAAAAAPLVLLLLLLLLQCSVGSWLRNQLAPI
jgi:hypothetical protein